MTTADEEIKQVLICCNTTEDKSLDVAFLFARAMLGEMRSATSEWRAAVNTLEKQIARRDAERRTRCRTLFRS
jgi:hypothetical protein